MKKTVVALILMIFTLSLVACEVEPPIFDDASISGIEDVTIALGDEFDRLEGVSATDHDGSDLLAKLLTEGIVNVNREGTYDVTYKVTGESGNEVVSSRIVTVVANASINGPELLATSIMVDSPFDPLEGVSATDIGGKDLTSEIIVTSSIIDENGIVDTSVEGLFVITYTVVGQSEKTVTVSIELTIFGLSDAFVLFTGTSDEMPNTYKLAVGFELDLALVATAKDYDNEVLDIDSIEYAASMDDLVVNNIFKPTEEGTYEVTYKTTGKNLVQSETVLTIVVIKQGIEIDGVFIPVLEKNINSDLKPWNTTLIYTELKGKGEYGVVVIVDAQGQIILTRDPYGTQYDLSTPIKQGAPEQIRGISNNEGWTGADNFKNLLGVQGTEGGIPEGGFAILFSRDSTSGSTHPIRTLGLLHTREYGAKVTVINLEVPNFNPSNDNASIIGANDIELQSNQTFDPMAGVSAKDSDGTDLTVSVIFNNIDMAKPSLGILNQAAEGFADGYYAVVYETTGANGHKMFVTRRVTVMPAKVDAVISGITDVSLAVGQLFDPLADVTAIDYDGTDITNDIVLVGEVDTATAADYLLTYKVTGANGVEVILTRTVTIAAEAHFEVSENRSDQVYKGESFDPFADIIALDHNGNDLTASIILNSELYNENIFDTSLVGVYTLEYVVTGQSGVPVSLELGFEVKAIPNATLNLNSSLSMNLFISQSFDLIGNATATDYNGASIETIDIVYDVSYDASITEGIFLPTAEGTYVFTYQATGANEVMVEVVLTIEIITSGITIDGVAIPLVQGDVNRPTETGKPKDSISIFTTLLGMGEYGVLTIVDAHGRIVLTRDAFGEQVDVNNPIKQGNPTYPTNLSGLPNFKQYDAYTNGLWTDWVKGGSDVFDGLLGEAGTGNGIPENGFAIYFAVGAERVTGLKFAREYGAKVEVYNLSIPNFDNTVSNTDATIFGVDDIEIEAGSTFDPMLNVYAVDNDNSTLTVSVKFTNVDDSKGVITPQAPRSVNSQEERDNFVQGYYSVVYSVTGMNGYEVNVTRKVTVR